MYYLEQDSLEPQSLSPLKTHVSNVLFILNLLLWKLHILFAIRYKFLSGLHMQVMMIHGGTECIVHSSTIEECQNIQNSLDIWGECPTFSKPLWKYSDVLLTTFSNFLPEKPDFNFWPTPNLFFYLKEKYFSNLQMLK
jgi:hypothetical protein